ncbi:MAG: hypothetical protein AB7L76_03085 [Burkholderiaceae bacterium]
MNVSSDSDLARVRDAATCRHWLQALPADGGERLMAIGALLGRMARPGFSADALFEVLEQVRTVQLRAIDQSLEPLLQKPLPYGNDDWQRIGMALVSLRSSRNLFKRAYSQMMGDPQGDETTRSIVPGAQDALRVVLPLARALDAQARLLTLLLRHRGVPQAADWDELCVLTQHLRRTTFVDEPLLDEVPLVQSRTARGLFTYPLLLSLAGLPARSAIEIQLTEQLASHLAGRIGFRIDHGPPRESPQGPTLSLTPEHSVRLDSHRLPPSFQRRREQSQAAAADANPRRRPLGERALLALLDDLERRWVQPGLALMPRRAPAAELRLRFGLPKMHSADMRVKVGAPDSAGMGGASGAGSSQYVYGRWEQNTIIRLSLGSDDDKRDAAALLMAESELVRWLEERPDGRLVVERGALTPRAGVGALVALQPPSGELILSTIEAIEQVPASDYLHLRGQRLTLRRWPGAPVPAGLRIADAMFFEDAWLLPGHDGTPPSVIVMPTHAQNGVAALLREPERDASVRFGRVIERGPGYERVELSFEGRRSPR